MATSPKKQIGVIPYIYDKGKLSFILITPKSSRNYWIFPKGNIEKELGERGSAVAEAVEEAGAKGTISRKPVAKYGYRKYGMEYTVNLYLLKVSELLDSWQEMDQRQRIVVKAKQVETLIEDKSLLKAFKKALKSIKKDL